MKTMYAVVPLRFRRACAVVAVAVAAVAVVVIPSPALADQTTQAPRPPAVETERLPNGRVVVAVADGGVSIRKEIGRTASHVVITTPTDALQIRVDSTGMTVSGPAGTVVVGQDGGAAAEPLRALLARSTAAKEGRTLLRRLPAASGHLGHQSLLLTRAVLELASGSTDALRQWSQARPGKAGPPVIIKAAQGAKDDRTAGECLDAYTKDAIAIYKDYLDCLQDVRWYEVHKQMACAAVYTFKAELAMMWVVNCVGGFPFSGN